MQKQFYVSHDGEDLGPFTKEQIEQKVKAKQLFNHDYVFIELKDDWVLLSEWLGQSEKTQEKSPEKPKTVVHAASSTPVMAATAASVPQRQTTETVRASHGEAQVSMKNDRAGLVSLQVEAKGLQSPTAIEIKFVAGPVHQFSIEGSMEARAGEPLRLTARAMDRFGNLSQFDETARLESQPRIDGLPTLTFKSGVASFEVKHTKIEPVEFKVTGIQGVNTTKSHRVNFKAGKAARIVVETPKEAQVGQETVIHVKAVDAFGNLDVTFSDVVTVKLGGVMHGETEVRLNQGVGSLKLGDKNVG
jgi:hypothetical protein